MILGVESLEVEVMNISCPTNPISLHRTCPASVTLTTIYTQGYPFVRTMHGTRHVPSLCAGLHRLPGQTIPWLVSASVSTVPSFSDALSCWCPSAGGSWSQAVPILPTLTLLFLVLRKVPATHRTQFKFTPHYWPPYALCFHLLFPARYLFHLKYLLIHRSPSEGYKLHEKKKKLFCLLITP